MEFSFLHVLFQSGWFMQLLSLSLIGLSIWVWTIIFEKIKSFRILQDHSKRFEADFFSKSSNLDLIYTKYETRAKQAPNIRLFLSVMNELKRAQQTTKNGVFLKERIEKIILSTIETETNRLGAKIDVLSVSTNVAPFLGLFGTVWGVMESFAAIGGAGNVNMSVVAPGVATALATTALGLIVAIPASIASHYFKKKIEDLENHLLTFGVELEMMVSRQLEEGRHAL